MPRKLVKYIDRYGIHNTWDGYCSDPDIDADYFSDERETLVSVGNSETQSEIEKYLVKKLTYPSHGMYRRCEFWCRCATSCNILSMAYPTLPPDLNETIIDVGLLPTYEPGKGGGMFRELVFIHDPDKLDWFINNLETTMT